MRVKATYLLLLLACSLGFCLSSAGQYRVAFYNLENLFYPEDDSLTREEEFTPQGNRYWSWYKYRQKSARMAKAILSIGEWEAPSVVGLAEVENRQVLRDMVEGPVLRKIPYEIVHFESPDRRGIDVAALYRSDQLRLVQAKAFALIYPPDPDFRSRDMLFLRLRGIGDSLSFCLLYCHWPSRYGGQAQSEPKRIAAAIRARRIYDSLRREEPNLAFLMLGDFNDEWHNQSLRETLQAKPPTEQEPETQGELINMMAALDPNRGSHRYRGVWSYLDQIIVSENLLAPPGNWSVQPSTAQVVRHPFLLESDPKYPGEKPFRTFIGFRYHGGFSDHLPIFVDLKRQEPEDTQP